MPPWQGVEGHLVVSVNGNDKEWIFIPHDIPDSQLIQTFCPKMWPMMEAVASPRDWRDPDVLVALGRATVTSTEAMALPHLESVAP